MFRTTAAIAAMSVFTPLPADAQDAEAGSTVFAKQCATCHVVVNEDGESLAGRRARTGPNLFGIAGGQAADVEDFRYGSGIEAAAEMGLVWDEANMIAYLKDTNAFLREFTGDKKVRSKMAWKVRKDEDAADVSAFLMSLE